MATSELPTWDGWCSQLKIILLGGRNSGKSSVGNLLLGKEEFVTRERTSCSRRLGVAAGRRLTVVDTPGWWCDFSAQDTSRLVKREIVCSVSLCPPGPHVFLITLKASSGFSEKRRRAVEEHVALLGEGAWRHCLVVFVAADTSEQAAAERLVQRGGPALCWLSDRCSQRCHSVVSGDEAGAAALLEKIQKLVAANGNRVFEMEGNILQAAEEERRSAERRAQQRLVRVKTHRALMRERLQPVTDIRIVLLGAKGSGKTSVLNTILSRDSSQPLRRTARCTVGRGVVFGRQVTVVDTPGWWMNYFSDETPAFDRRELVLSLSLCPPGPNVFLLVIRVDRAFSETYGRAVQEHLQLISEHIWSRVIVLFSFGDWMGSTTTEQCIEGEGGPLQRLVERCSDRYHVLNNKTKGDGFQVRELIGKIEEMLAGCSGGLHYETDREVMEQLEGKIRRETAGAEERLMRRQKLRQMAKSQLGELDTFKSENLSPLPEVRLVLVGGSKTGKSSCGDTILGRESFHAETRTTSCSEIQDKISGRMVTVLDTPGGFCVTSDLLVGTCALLLVVNVSSSFKTTHMEALEKQLQAGGGQMWSRGVVLFSFGDWLGDTSVEQRIESEGEPLQRLVEKCGNRYHVFDNKLLGDGAQVNELIELIDEMLAGERLETHRGDHMWRSVSSQDVTLCENDSKTPRSCQLDLTESTTLTSLSCSGGAGHDGQLVSLPAGRRTGRRGLLDRDRLLSCLASLLSGAERWSTDVPAWLPADELHLDVGRRLFSSRHPTMLLVLPQTQHRMIVGENGVRSLCHPALRERALRRLAESGSLQALIDQWGDSSLEELEAFIDSYFETVWEQTMVSCQDPERPTAGQEAAAEEEAEAGQQEVLSSIDRKLSKLELLEDIRADVAQLRTSLENSWRVIQELQEKSKQDDSNTC